LGGWLRRLSKMNKSLVQEEGIQDIIEGK